MDGDEGDPEVDPTRGRGPDRASAVPASTWLGVAVIGAAVFVLGIWMPAWRGVPFGVLLSYLAAIGGAVLFIAGLTLAERARHRPRPTPVVEMPGVEVYHPPARGRVASTEPALDEDQG
ncbi:MAG: hypothetical protein L3K10_02760 [Thermoplasmata archaeon]|nr:hypothetical protein [Thermoplasmata archaeon]